jgi:hypothetical protein
LRDWGSKLPGAAARIAGVMHCVCISPEDSAIIGAAVMEHALNLSVLLIDHAIAVFDLMRRDPVMEDAQRILRWIRKQVKRFHCELRSRHFGRVKTSCRLPCGIPSKGDTTQAS